MIKRLEFLFIYLLLNRKGILTTPQLSLVSSSYAVLSCRRSRYLKSAVDPKYALLCMDLFSSKIYVYPTKIKSNLAKKLQPFYREIQPKCEGTDEKMKLQTDLEFQQIQINRLNEKYNFDMFSTKVRG